MSLRKIIKTIAILSIFSLQAPLLAQVTEVSVNTEVQVGAIDLEANKKITLDVSRAIMSGDWDKLDSLLSEDFTYTGDGMHFNKDQYIGFMQDLYLAMRDMKMEFNQVYAEGEFVTVRFTNPMKNMGSFMGGPATEKLVTAEGIFIRQVRNGKVIKENQTTDLLGLMTQMGFGALAGYTVFVGLFGVTQDLPQRKTTAEMKKRDAELKKEGK